MPQHFKLSSELIDQIIFAMENQNETFMLETDSLMIISADHREKDSDAYLPLPQWTPSDGYQLMDSFTGILKNPVYTERLRAVLSSGRGVFRGFKNILKERSDLEKAWFAHKDRIMKRRVQDWYAELCEYWGVEDLGDFPEETDDLFLDEFSMDSISPDSPELQVVFDSFIRTLYSESSEGLKKIVLKFHPHPRLEADFVLRAVSPEGASCAYLAVHYEQEGNELFAVINLIYVIPEYRGAGIASGLLDKLCMHCYKENVHSLLMTLPPEGEVLRNNLARRGFESLGPTLVLNVERWYYEQENGS